MGGTNIYLARRVVTMDPTLPEATHVAVRDGRILGAGGAELPGLYPGATQDHRFAEKIIVPGFVEGHAHASEGLVWRKPYLGYFDRTMPDGGTAPGVKTLAEALTRLRSLEAELPPDEPLLVWGFDPIYYDGPRLHGRDLDAISATRPIVVSHASGHIINVNSMVLERAGFERRFQPRWFVARRKRADRRADGPSGDAARDKGRGRRRVDATPG